VCRTSDCQLLRHGLLTKSNTVRMAPVPEVFLLLGFFEKFVMHSQLFKTIGTGDLRDSVSIFHY